MHQKSLIKPVTSSAQKEKRKVPSVLADPMHVALVCLCLQSPLSRDVCSSSIWKKIYAKGHSSGLQNIIFKRVGGED